MPRRRKSTNSLQGAPTPAKAQNGSVAAPKTAPAKRTQSKLGKNVQQNASSIKTPATKEKKAKSAIKAKTPEPSPESVASTKTSLSKTPIARKTRRQVAARATKSAMKAVKTPAPPTRKTVSKSTSKKTRKVAQESSDEEEELHQFGIEANDFDMSDDEQGDEHYISDDDSKVSSASDEEDAVTFDQPDEELSDQSSDDDSHKDMLQSRPVASKLFEDEDDEDNSDEEDDDSENAIDMSAMLEGSDDDDDDDELDEEESDDEISDDDSDAEAAFLKAPKSGKRGISLEAAGAALTAQEDQIVAEAEEDMKLHIASSASDAALKMGLNEEEEMLGSFELPTPEQLAREDMGPPDLQLVKQRMRVVTAILSDFRKYRDPNRARTEYLDVLNHDLRNFYGYTDDLIQLFLRLFSPGEAIEFLEANEQPRPVVIRTNTLKTRRRELAQALIARGVNVDPLAAWSKVGLKVYESPVPIGATPEYLAGHYMLQSASSFWPCIALAPRPGERVLDMASAPGGKTTYLGQMMRNKGLLIANDAKIDRTHALVANIHRLGITNTITSCYDGRKIPEVLTGFDRVLLDAPCTGLGVISRDPSIKTQKTYADVLRMAHLQKQLLLAAIDSCDANSKSGGYIVYSTCSVSVEENEAVVDYALKHRCVKLVPLTPVHAAKKPETEDDDTMQDRNDQMDVGLPGMTRHEQRRFHQSVQLTRRFYPHVHNMDGFFVAKFKKYANALPANATTEQQPNVSEEDVSDNENEDTEMITEENEIVKTSSANNGRTQGGAEQIAQHALNKVTKKGRNQAQKRAAETAAEIVPEKQSGGKKSKKQRKLPAEVSASVDASRLGPMVDVAVDNVKDKKSKGNGQRTNGASKSNGGNNQQKASKKSNSNAGSKATQGKNKIGKKVANSKGKVVNRK